MIAILWNPLLFLANCNSACRSASDDFAFGCVCFTSKGFGENILCSENILFLEICSSLPEGFFSYDILNHESFLHHKEILELSLQYYYCCSNGVVVYCYQYADTQLSTYCMDSKEWHISRKHVNLHHHACHAASLSR